MAPKFSKPQRNKKEKPYYELGDSSLHEDKHICLLMKYLENLEQKLKDGKIVEADIKTGKVLVKIDGVSKTFTCIEKYKYLFIDQVKNNSKCLVPVIPKRYNQGKRGIFYKKFTKADATPTSEDYILMPVFPCDVLYGNSPPNTSRRSNKKKRSDKTPSPKKTKSKDANSASVGPPDDDCLQAVINFAVTFMSMTQDDNNSKNRRQQAPREVRKAIMTDVDRMLPINHSDEWRLIVAMADDMRKQESLRSGTSPTSKELDISTVTRRECQKAINDYHSTHMKPVLDRMDILESKMDVFESKLDAVYWYGRWGAILFCLLSILVFANTWWMLAVLEFLFENIIPYMTYSEEMNEFPELPN